MSKFMLFVAMIWMNIFATFAYGADQCSTVNGITQTRLPLYAQSSCCTLHQGPCGCRGSRVICCDGTLSRNCGCLHADDDIGQVSKESMMQLIELSGIEVSTRARK